MIPKVKLNSKLKFVVEKEKLPNSQIKLNYT